MGCSESSSPISNWLFYGMKPPLWTVGVARAIRRGTACRAQGWPFHGCLPHARRVLLALVRLRRPSGAWGGTKNRPCQRPIPLPPLPETPSREFEISNPCAINKVALPSPSTLHPGCYCGPVRALALQGATDWRTPAGIYVLHMASVGEPINRPRHTEQRDRSQTVLAAPRDTKGAAPYQAAPGAPPRGPPRRWQTSSGPSAKKGRKMGTATNSRRSF